jgi:hypothetical protein
MSNEPHNNDYFNMLCPRCCEYSLVPCYWTYDICVVCYLIRKQEGEENKVYENKVEENKVIYYECEICNKTLAKIIEDINGVHFLCSICLDKYYGYCHDCKKYYKKEQMAPNKDVCNPCDFRITLHLKHNPKTNKEWIESMNKWREYRIKNGDFVKDKNGMYRLKELIHII